MPKRRVVSLRGSSSFDKELEREHRLKELIRQRTNGITLTEIEEHFNRHAIEFSGGRRTIQRTLDRMVEKGILKADGIRPLRYIMIPGQDRPHNLSLDDEGLQIVNLALSLLENLGPKSLEGIIGKTYEALEDNLKGTVKGKFSEYRGLQKVRASHLGKSVHTHEGDMKEILYALRERKVLQGVYKSKNSKTNDLRTLGIIDLTFFGGSPYLLAEDLNQETPTREPQWFKIARFVEGTIKTDKKKYSPPKIDEVCEKFQNSYSGASPKKVFPIRFLGDDFLGEHFSEFILHPSQKLSRTEDGLWLLEFETYDSPYFYRYMSGFGGHIIDIESDRIREELERIWRKGLVAFDYKVAVKRRGETVEPYEFY